MTKTIDIEGMGCGGCVRKVNEVLSAIEGVESVEVSLDNNNAVVTHNGNVTDDALKAAVESKGFIVHGIA